MKHALEFAVSVVFLSGIVSATVRAEQVDFGRDIKPILSNNCYFCHGPDENQRQAGLRLDARDGTVADLGGYAAVVPGKPEESELIRRISAADEDERMPPAHVGKQLSQRDIDLLTRWVQEGAEYSPHWSYVTPTRPVVPSEGQDWSRNPIDHFIARGLAVAGLGPSPRADRYTLIRRLALDLTGLPPTVKEVDEFVADTSDDAYARLTERLLSQDAYGEHWASMWLDLARYADSAGYADDPPRTIWGYRDYVIRAFNQNKPFDQFTIEQIAGDLLPDPTEDQLIATAFHRNTVTNSEGGTNDEEFRNVAVVDRVNTTMAVWMGTTMACAQCHSHKYDPITQREYFEFFALFNNTQDADRRDEAPTLPLYSREQKRNRDRWQAELAQLRDGLQEARDSARDRQPAWEARVASETADDVGPLGRFVRIEIPGRAEFLSLAEVQVFQGDQNIAASGKATQSSTAFGGPARLAIDGNTDGDYPNGSTTHTNKNKSPWWQVDLGDDFQIDRIVVWNRTDGAVGSRLRDYRVSILDADEAEVWGETRKKSPQPSAAFDTPGIPQSILELANIPASDRTKQQQKTLRAFYLPIDPQVRAVTSKIRDAENRLNALKPMTTVPIMRERASAELRETFVQIRGNFMDVAEMVGPGVPGAFHDWPVDVSLDRLGLAEWLVSRDNPLTARVIANRYWEQLFGTGFVATSEDFGSQGELPSHPELLDWLAMELIESGWNTKHLIRLIVNSATYQQTSRATDELLEKDPFNRLLSRGPRVRISAEIVRDQALAVSGLLSKKMYGPPVHPPRPKLDLRAAFGSTTDWEDSEGEDRYRRAIYTELRRSMPYPAMATFDAPNREVCMIRRSRTNTPLQAFVTLNGRCTLKQHKRSPVASSMRFRWVTRASGPPMGFARAWRDRRDPMN